VVLLASPSSRDRVVDLASSLATGRPGAHLRHHAGRSGPGPGSIRTNVSARCRQDADGLVCAERIDIDLGSSTVSRATSILSALSVSEVPTGRREHRSGALAASRAAGRIANRLIVDSAAMGIERVREVVRDTGAHVADLGWLRLGSWCNPLARCFDEVPLRPAVTAIRKVSITTTPLEGGRTSDAARLLLGWLGSRLRWKFASAQRAVDPLQAGIEIHTEWRLAEGLAPGVLLSVELDALLGDAPVHIALSRDGSPPTLYIERVAEGMAKIEHRVALGEPSSLLSVDEAINAPLSDAILRQTFSHVPG